jgi:hypothetical protein
MEVMRNRWLLPALLLGLGIIALSVASTAAEKATDAQIRKLIEQLGSDEYDAREKATDSLDKIGAPALEALRKAAKNGDAEVSRRADELVSRIEKRGETSAILAPKKVKLVFKDTPVPQAVEELRKQSGYNIVLQDPKNTLKDRKITLNTGEVPFWQALDQLCEKAGLVEADPSQGVPMPGPGGPPRGPGAGPGVLPGGKVIPIEIKPVEIKPIEKKTLPAKEKGLLGVDDKAEKTGKADAKPGAVGGPVAGTGTGIALPGKPGPGFRPPVMTTPDQITLVEGKPAKLAADYSSAVRVRALAKADRLGKPAADQILLALQASPEPEIKWQNLVQLKITKAIDDQDQKLEQVAPANEATPAPAGPAGPGAPAPGIRPIALPPRGGPIAFWGSLNQTLPVHLKKGAKASKSLKELSGVITAQVLAPAKAFITVEDLMKAAGKTIKGAEGGSIKITGVSKDRAGNIQVRFEMELPAGVTPANTGTNAGPIGLPTPGTGPAPDTLPVRPIKGAVPAKPALRGALAVDVTPPPAPAPAPAGKVGIAIAVRPGVGFGGPGNGITVLDDKGNKLPVGVGIQVRGGPAGKFTQEYVITVPAKMAEPAKLVFMGQKSVTIDIPFILKNVTLP